MVLVIVSVSSAQSGLTNSDTEIHRLEVCPHFQEAPSAVRGAHAHATDEGEADHRHHLRHLPGVHPEKSARRSIHESGPGKSLTTTGVLFWC